MCNLTAHSRHAQLPRFPIPGRAVLSRDHRCSSEIGSEPDSNDLLPYDLVINVFIETPSTFNDRVVDHGGIDVDTYTCTVASDSVRDHIFSSFRDSIDRHWNEKLWLQPPPPGRARQRTPAKGLKCGIRLERVDSAAQSNLHILVLYQPDHELRDFCWRLGGQPGGRRGDMVLAYPQPGARVTDNASSFSLTYNQIPSSDQGTNNVTQNVAAHEFGHYIMLRHTCARQSGADTNADIAYCSGRTLHQIQSLMSYGERIDAHHAFLWERQLQRHHYNCELSFSKRTLIDNPP